MTPKQRFSGETINQGRISKKGSTEVRALLHEAGIVLITRTKAQSKLKSWGLKKKRRLKTQKAGMAVGRKIAINLHRMWIEDRDFDPQLDVENFYSEESGLMMKGKERSKSKKLKQ